MTGIYWNLSSKSSDQENVDPSTDEHSTIKLRKSRLIVKCETETEILII